MAMSEDPLQDNDISLDQHPSQIELAQDPPQSVKRKGGRKPVYTTVQERKQRNRMAQAAFRERRTEYIKQLEDALKDNEDQIQLLQRNSQAATEECHMLRYKTSLLEDLLYENGIDYQSELHSRSSRSLLGSPYDAQPSNGQVSMAQVSSDAEQSRAGGIPNTPSQMRPIKQKSKPNSINNINIHSSESFEMKSEPSSARTAPIISPFDSPGLLSTNFDYSGGPSHSMHSAIHDGRFQFQDTRIDPSISEGAAEPYYPMAPHPIGMHLDSERESRTSSLDETAMQGFRNDHARQDSMSYYRNAQAVRVPQSPHSIEHPLHRRQQPPAATGQTRFLHERGFGQPTGLMDSIAAGALNHGPLPEDFEIDTDSLD